MKEIYLAIAEAKNRVMNNINALTSEECDKLKLYEQLGHLESAESAMLGAIKADHSAREENPEMFVGINIEPLVVV